LKKLLISLGIIILLLLIAGGIASLTGGLDSITGLIGLATATPIPTPVALEPAPETADTPTQPVEPEPPSDPTFTPTPSPEAPETTEPESPTPESSPSPRSSPTPEATQTPAPEALPVTDTPTPTPTATPTVTPTATLVVAQESVQQQPAATNTPPGALPASGNMSGNWDFNFGEMTLTQTGVSISGDYRWYGGLDQGRITGSFVYDTNQITGLWISQNPLEQGFFNWRLLDAQNFTGTFENNRLNGQWCGVRAGESLPPGCGFSGTWNLRFGAPGEVFGQAILTQTGQRVTGSYTAADGRTGEIEGSIGLLSLTEAGLRGSWRDATGETGSFEWRLNVLTGRTFEGRRLEGNSEWCGWRDGVDRPDPCGF
jgi:hypothetical protein